MEGLIIAELPQDLRALDPQTLLQAKGIPDPDVDFLDEILSQVPNPEEIQLPEVAENNAANQALLSAILPELSATPDSTTGSAAASSSGNRFADPVGESDVKAAQDAAIPINTKKNTTWAVNVWKQWSEHRRSVSPTDWPPHLFICSAWDLNHWLCRFVLEVRRQDGKNYPPNTL